MQQDINITSAFQITSEESFYQYINKLLTETDLDSEHFEFPAAEFKGWPILHFNVKGGEKYHSTISTYLIDGLKEFTDEIFRAYCVVKYGTPDLRRFKESDREEFDVVIKIAEGSSDGESDASKIANSFFTNMNDTLKTMNGWKQVAAFIAYIGVLGGVTGGLGYIAITQYFENQKEQSKALVEMAKQATEQQKNQAEAFTEMAKNNNQTIQMLISQGSSLFSQELERRGEQAENGFMRHIAKDPMVTEAKVNDVHAQGDELEQFKTPVTTVKGKLEKADNFYIKGIERTGQFGEIISITARRDDGIILNLKAKSDKLSEQQKQILANELVVEEEKRTFVRLAYKETTRNGKKTGQGELISVAYK